MNNKSVWAVIVIVVIILVGGGLLLANKNSDNNTTPNPATSNTSQADMNSSNPNNNSTNSTTPTATDKVDIKDMAFSPADITVKAGTTVTWTNNDSITHDVTETDGQDGPNSGAL
jgi:plastocyanin